MFVAFIELAALLLLISIDPCCLFVMHVSALFRYGARAKVRVRCANPYLHIESSLVDEVPLIITASKFVTPVN